MRIICPSGAPVVPAGHPNQAETIMARTRKNQGATRKRTNLTLDPQLFRDVQEYCSAEGISVSELVNRLLQEQMLRELKKGGRSGARPRLLP